MPPSSVVAVFTSQSGENDLPFSDVTPVHSNSSSDIHLLIALQKGKHICISHFLSNFVFYFHLLSSYSAFIFL